MKSYLCIFALIIGVICSSAQDEDTNSWKHPEPISYEVLRAWHKNGGLQKYIWPKEHQADLNDDNVNEVFLGISGYGRGMTYALFTKTNKGWILLSEEIEGSHHDFEVLECSPRVDPGVMRVYGTEVPLTSNETKET
jgi:hypothetical protein